MAKCNIVLLLCSIVIIISIVSSYITKSIHKSPKKNKLGVSDENEFQQSFKKIFDISNFPVIQFSNNGFVLNLLIDTGAENSCFDASILNKLKYIDLEKDILRAGIDDNPMSFKTGKIIVSDYLDRDYTMIFCAGNLTEAFNSIEKNSGVRLHGLIGNDFLKKYKSVIDFDKMVIHLKANK